MQRLWLLAAVALAALLMVAAPSVYPTGTTIFDPAKTWNGYTVLTALGGQAVVVIDMNGNVVKRWEGYNNSAGGPARVFPGGAVVAAAGANPGKQESLELVARNFAGDVLWRLDRNEEIQTKDGGKRQSLRQHHDWAREDFPAGYYSPQVTPSSGAANTLVLTHTNRVQPKVAAGVTLEDDRLLEIAPDGKILWEWIASDHVDELKFDKPARDAMAGLGGAGGRGGAVDWIHLNSATYLGPNRWFDAGDQRFAPQNVIVSSREASLLAIVARNGSIVWQLGPDFTATPELQAIRQIIGQHKAHLIPKGLPGAGNLMVFDNGGSSGYGPPSSLAPKGKGVWARPTSRVLEIDPVTLKLVWSYTSPTFFATNISGAQRLPNGNTLITEGPSGRIFEVTTDGTIVWEYVYPVFTAAARPTNSVYRAYRLPYEWMPQVQRPQERAVTPPPAGDFRVP